MTETHKLGTGFRVLHGVNTTCGNRLLGRLHIVQHANVAHDHLDDFALISEFQALLRMARKRDFQVLLSLLVGILPLLILVLCKAGALFGLLRLLDGQTISRFALQPGL